MSIDPTTLWASGITATVIGFFQVLANRYGNRGLDHIEKLLKLLLNGREKKD